MHDLDGERRGRRQIADVVDLHASRSPRRRSSKYLIAGVGPNRLREEAAETVNARNADPRPIGTEDETPWSFTETDPLAVARNVRAAEPPTVIVLENVSVPADPRTVGSIE